MSVWLPTRFSKSICYQAIPVVMEHNTGQLDGCAVLVVPLVSLMINQVESKLFGKEVKMAVLLFGICIYRAWSTKF